MQPAAGLYAAMANFIQDYKKKESERMGFSTLKDSEIFHLLIFLARLVRNWTNGRPRARIYLQLLRGLFPQAHAPQPEALAASSPHKRLSAAAAAVWRNHSYAEFVRGRACQAAPPRAWRGRLGPRFRLRVSRPYLRRKEENRSLISAR